MHQLNYLSFWHYVLESGHMTKHYYLLDHVKRVTIFVFVFVFELLLMLLL